MAAKKDQTLAPGPVVLHPAAHLPGAFLDLANQMAQRTAHVFHVDGKPFAAVPCGDGRVEIEDMEKHLKAPTRIREATQFLDLDSFIGYVNRFKDEDVSVIFIDTIHPKVMAVLDYHDGRINPSWCDHKAVYAFPHTVEWKEWTAANKQKMDQQDMGLFIEDHLDQITHPEANKLLQAVLRMKETRQVTFGQATALQSGMVQFNYVEENGEGGHGRFELPEIMQLHMAPFRDGHSYTLGARVRYRTSREDGLILWYELIRPDRVLDQAIKDVRAQVESATNLPVYAAHK